MIIRAQFRDFSDTEPARLLEFVDFYPDLSLEFQLQENTVKYVLLSAIYYEKEREHFVSYCRLLNEDGFYYIDDTEDSSGRKLKIKTNKKGSRVPDEMRGGLNSYPSLLFYVIVDE
jgi:hypothetical protein